MVRMLRSLELYFCDNCIPSLFRINLLPLLAIIIEGIRILIPPV